MIKAKAPSPLPYLITAIVLLVGGYRWFHPPSPESTIVRPSQPKTSPAQAFAPPNTVPRGTVVNLDGSTSMVTLNQNLKRAFEQQFPGTQVLTQARGSTRGIQGLLAGQVDVAATSRPLTAAETQQGLRSVVVANDAIAIVIGNRNPFQGGLTPEQVRGIFQGTLVNWSQVGGPNTMIRVINRPAFSGTHQTFKEQVLQDSNFGTTTNITTLPQDATTPLLRALSEDGIGYATAAQVINQQTVRVVPVLDKLPDHPDYLYRRPLYYVYRNPPDTEAQAFLGFVLSPQGQQAIVQEP